MVKRNSNFGKLQAGYLFPEINRRKNALLEKEPDAKIISLGIGNTTEPLTPVITGALKDACDAMATVEGYSGYGDEQGMTALREQIASVYYEGKVDGQEVFISDGSKCDVARVSVLFGAENAVAVQDPSYPAYVDNAVIMGQTEDYNSEGGLFDGVTYLSCSPENNYFPDLSLIKEGSVIYFCSPNNPTGAVATREQLKELVDTAKEKKSIIVFDAAYSMFIQDPSLPRSILDIEGAREVAIEMNSLSKPAGFTGVRLGWSVVPKELCFEDGTQVRNDWNRIMTTLFNGASNIIQQGALKAFSPEGMSEMKGLIDYYMANAKVIKLALIELGFETYGGDNAPYIWARIPGKNSWDTFEDILKKAHVVTTPGSGFGPAGEGFIRFSAFGHQEEVKEAVERLKKIL